MLAVVTSRSVVWLEPTMLTNPTTTAIITNASFVKGSPLAESTMQFTITVSSQFG